MATSSGVLCAVCAAQYITKCAEVWCPECEEGFCIDCQKHHSIIKATRTHGTIHIDQYQTLPPSISNINHYCQAHDIKYTKYCPNHDKLCCPACIATTHVTCTGFLSVYEIIKTSKTSTLLDTMERSLNDIDKNIEKVIQNREQKMSEVRQQRNFCIDRIKEIRAKITSHLDTLEQKFINDVNAVEENIQSKIDSSVDRLSTERTIVQELKNNITAIKKHASDLQTYFGIKEYQPKVKKAEQIIESLLEDGSLDQLSLKCNINGTIWNKLSQTKSFGSISIKIGPPAIVFKTGKEKQAQITAIIQQPSPKSINDIKLSLLHTYNMTKSGDLGYRGCIIHPNGKLILTDHLRCALIVLNDDGTVEKDLPCSTYVNDLTTIDNRTVAVSTIDGIDIINIDSKQTEKVIKTSKTCYGITHHKGTLLWCKMKKGIQRMNLSDGRITTLVKQHELPECSHVTPYGDKIYQTNHETKTVTCYTTNGQKQWEFQNEAVLVDPTCITIDNYSYIYITSEASSSVVILTPDGKEGRQVLSKIDGLNKPWGIYFEKTKNNLLVINKKGPAFLYHIS